MSLRGEDTVLVLPELTDPSLTQARPTSLFGVFKELQSRSIMPT